MPTIFYSTVDGSILKVDPDTYTPQAGEAQAGLTFYPDDWHPDEYFVDLNADPPRLARKPDEVNTDTVHTQLYVAYHQAYRAEVEIIRPRLIGIFYGTDELNDIVLPWLNARWHALRNLFRPDTLVNGTVITATTSQKLLALQGLTPADAQTAEDIAERLAQGTAPAGPTDARLWIDVTASNPAVLNLTDAISYGQQNGDYKVPNIEWLPTS